MLSYILYLSVVSVLLKSSTASYEGIDIYKHGLQTFLNSTQCYDYPKCKLQFLQCREVMFSLSGGGEECVDKFMIEGLHTVCVQRLGYGDEYADFYDKYSTTEMAIQAMYRTHLRLTDPDKANSMDCCTADILRLLTKKGDIDELRALAFFKARTENKFIHFSNRILSHMCIGRGCRWMEFQECLTEKCFDFLLP